ncbi:hypothetical protein ACFWR9_41760 [Streptomyces sp. NPDC058534]|uniref:hypothetical protein n=1 Tax=Streptomyces sp. NPDC058534 TaxID=3346541 RepID=UPI003658E450
MTTRTPADELRTAAAALRPSSPAVAAHTVTVRLPADAVTALADWLDHAANYYDCGLQAADDVFHDDPAGRDAFLTTGPGAPSAHALAVAHAITHDAP